VVVALLQGWGVNDDPRMPVFNIRTPAFNRLAKRAAATTLVPAPQPASLSSALTAIALGAPPQLPTAEIDTLVRAEGGISAHAGFQSFVKELTRVGGDCHLLCCLTGSGIEGQTGHAAKIAASLSHAGIRVWVHAVLDGRDTAPDAALACMHDFLEDVSGVDMVRFATVSGRALALDETADAKSLAKVRDAIVDAAPQSRVPLGDYIDTENRSGTGDAEIAPTADPAYPGMRSDDALLVLHPQADGFAALLQTLVPGDDLSVPSARPATLSACRRVIGWPLAGTTPQATARQPIALFQPHHPRLPDLATRKGLSLLMSAPTHQIPLWAAAMEGCTPDAAKTQMASGAVEAADIAVQAVKGGQTDLIFTLLGGVPAAARTPDRQMPGSPTRRVIEQQDKGLGRIAAILERRGGTLIAVGTDTSLAAASGLPCLIHGGGIDQDTALASGTLADVGATVLALAGLAPEPEIGGASLLNITGDHHAEAS